MKYLLLGLLFGIFLASAVQASQFTNVDSLEYWNRSVELNDSLLRLKKKETDAQGILSTATELLRMQEKLIEKSATTEDEYRTHLWQKEDAELAIEDNRTAQTSVSIYQRIATLNYQWASGEKPEAVSDLVSLYADQWKNRVEEAKISLKRDEAELKLREWQFKTGEILLKKGAVSLASFIRVRDTYGELLGRRELSLQRIALAEKALADAQSTETRYLSAVRGATPPRP